MRVLSCLGVGIAAAMLAGGPARAGSAPRTGRLSFEERVELEARLLRVQDSHRSWPRPEPRPPFEQRMPRADIEQRVERSLKMSALLPEIGAPEIDARSLQAEMDRMARSTQAPGVLAELFGVLEDDPGLVAECLARPAIAERAFVDARRRERVPARDLERWLGALDPAGWRTPALAVGLRTPAITGTGAAFSHQAPDGRKEFTAVWTGTELIVWGGRTDSGGRYDPASDAWVATSLVGAPAPRYRHTAVWTGREMIVWGGHEGSGVELGSGGRYDPAADAWTPTAIAGSPTPRAFHVAVWTGTEMVVWGGQDGVYETSTGGRYDPDSDSWRATSTAPGVPTARRSPAHAWTGRFLVVWGGYPWSSGKSGGRYDPLADAWLPVATGPVFADASSAVWTGSEVLFWGSDNTTQAGARYDPTLDSWRTMAVTPETPSIRSDHTTVWTGSEMIVWGGIPVASGLLSSGGRYRPATDSWARTSEGAGVPSGRAWHRAAWTGREMVVWGGDDHDLPIEGALYDPASDRWRPTATGAVAEPRNAHASVWTGAELIVWGGHRYASNLDTGGRYDPATDAWRPTALDAATPEARTWASLVWTGSEAIAWGGWGDCCPVERNSGGAYDPVRDRWTTVAVDAATPSPRAGHAAVWTGREMIVWGGIDSAIGAFDTGGRYDPASRTWRPTSIQGAPAARPGPGGVWTGKEMIVWGGGWYGQSFFAHGGRYDPETDAWSPVSTSGQPRRRLNHSMVWTGSEVLVWGGQGSDCCVDDWLLDTGGLYDPGTDRWRTITPAPTAVEQHADAWTGRELVVWGGLDRRVDQVRTGARYDLHTDTWRTTSTLSAPIERYRATGAWTGDRFLVWGGWRTETQTEVCSGGGYAPDADSWHEQAPLPPLVAVAKGTGGGGAYDTWLAAFRPDGMPTLLSVQAFPGHAGWGSRVGMSSLSSRGALLAAPGWGATSPAQVRGFDGQGLALPGLDFFPYATPGWGCNVQAGAIGSDEHILTGPGPSPASGPHVRAHRYVAASVTASSRVSFFAYGTPRFGVQPASGDVDGDGFDEILAAPGPGEVFGPHVRGFDVDGGDVTAMAGVSFFAYTTLRFGAEAAGGDVDGDGSAEILTGPGAGIVFGAHLRAFERDGAPMHPIAAINAFVFAGARYGLHVAAGELDLDGRDEITCGPGPDPLSGTRLAAFDFDGTLAPIPALSRDAFGLQYGLQVAAGALGP